MPTYYFAIASQQFLFEEEPLEEVLRERMNYYQSISKPIDFWLIKNPLFVDLPELVTVKKSINQPVAAIISYDFRFINWIKLRIGFVLTGKYHGTEIA